MSRAQVDTYGIHGSELPLHFLFNGLGMLTWEPGALRRGIHHGNINKSGCSAVSPNMLQTFKYK